MTKQVTNENFEELLLESVGQGLDKLKGMGMKLETNLETINLLGLKIEKLQQEKKLLVECVGNVREFYPRFWSKVGVKKKRECWEWQSSIAPNGYGKFSVNNYPVSAHVLSYKYFNTDHDKNMCIDHTCRNRKCVNPNHLRQVTKRINAIENSNSVAAVNSKKTHCVNGHPFSGSNLIFNSRNDRVCKLCRDKLNKKRGSQR